MKEAADFVCIYRGHPACALAGIVWPVRWTAVARVKKQNKNNHFFSGTAFFTQEEQWIKREIFPANKPVPVLNYDYSPKEET